MEKQTANLQNKQFYHWVRIQTLVKIQIFFLAPLVIKLFNLPFFPFNFSGSRCKILDKHLALLAKKHVETKFIKLNAEKAPFLSERLRIKVIPTLALLLDGKTKDYVVGFTDLGNTDEFSTEMLEWRLGCADVINYR